MRKSGSFLQVDGTPLSNGRLIGRACRMVLRKRISILRRIQKRRKIPEKLMAARIKDFTRNVRRVARHWLDEVKGIAEGAGVAADDIIMLNCLPAGFRTGEGQAHSAEVASATKAGSCTTFVSVGKDENRLFKIRDQWNDVQAFLVNRAKGHYAFQVGRDVGNIGAGHIFNSRFVAGANDTGSHTTFVPDEPRLNDCHMLRFFAENASCVEDIPALFERLLDKGVAGGAGKERGAIFAFADPRRGLILECQASDYVATFVGHGTRVVSNHFLSRRAKAWISREPNKNTLLRKKRMEELLSKHGNRPSPNQVFTISRDRKLQPHSLCNDDKKHFWMTVSAQLQCINRKAPERSVNYVCCGNTRNSVFLPVPITFAGSFEPMLSGRFYICADRLYKKHGCGPHLRGTQNAFEKSALSRTDYRQVFADAYAFIRRAE